MSNGLEIEWKENDLALFRVLSQNSPGDME